ncbi:MAG: AmmeMemoRadiSam system protein A [Terriglobia bacterium]
MPLTEADRKLLLDYSRSVLARSVRGLPAPVLENASPALHIPCGAFVTLRPDNGELRGCIGRVTTSEALFQTVADCTVDASTHDPRFSPVTPEELAGLLIEISVLSELTEARPEDVEVGRHGLLISMGLRRGLLLPQVPTEWGWDRERFLDETCLKSGLPPHAWRHGARVQVFTAEVFREARNSPDAVTTAMPRSSVGKG